MIKTRKAKAYPGDRTIRIEQHLNDGRVLIIMNIWRCRDRIGQFYRNDRDSTIHRTIADVKKYAGSLQA